MMASVIIPVFNDLENLPACLQALTNTGCQDFEMILVDDGSGAAQPIAAMADKYACRLVRLDKNVGPAQARNVGARHARGQVLVFTDSDCRAMPDYIFRITQALVEAQAHDPDMAAVYGSLVPPPDFWKQCDAYTGYAYVLGGKRGLMNYLNTACAAIDRRAFEAVGGFACELRAGEDIQLAQKLVQSGWRIIYEPAITVEHRHRGLATLADLVQKHYLWGLRMGLALDRQRQGIWRWALRRFSHPGWHAMAALPLALGTTVKILVHHLRQGRWGVIRYAPFVLLGKIAFRWGICRRGAEDRWGKVHA